MKFSAFQKEMKKPAFTFAEAQIVAHDQGREVLRLSLHRWASRGDLIRVRRGVYAFADRPVSLPETIDILYPPAYMSLESALNQHGLLPDVSFELTVVTTRPTRSFETIWGRFRFHKIQRELFLGFDPETKLAIPEKALLDWFYFRGTRFVDAPAFWKETRLQNLEQIRWKEGDALSKLYPQEKIRTLWKGLKRYAKTA